MELQARRTSYLNVSTGSVDNLVTVTDVSQTTMCLSDKICSLPARATSSHGSLGWPMKRRKQVGFVTLTSQDVRSFEPIYEQDLSFVTLATVIDAEL
ncbi:hypothetical protein L1887_00176 [Cichorium endivia]|nr:hypothetical protein L1887_00176 [Cichorium endivia]